MVIYGEIAKQCQSIAIPCRYRVRSDMLLDNSGDDPQCNAVFLIQVGNGKADIILSSGSAPIIAGMCYGIGTVAKADIHNALMDMGDLPGIFALNTAFLKIVILAVAGYAFDVGFNSDVLRLCAVNLQHAYQSLVAHSIAVMSIADPVPRKVASQNGCLHAKHFDPDDLLRHSDHTGFYHASVIDTILSVTVLAK